MSVVDEIIANAVSGAVEEHQREVVQRMTSMASPLLIGAYNTEMRLPGSTAHGGILGLSAAYATAMSTIIHHHGATHDERVSLLDVVARVDEQMLRAFVRNEVGRRN